MNNLKDRVLDDAKGFVSTGVNNGKPLEQQVVELTQQVQRLSKQRKESDHFHKKQKDVERVKLVDNLSALEKEVRSLKRENDKLKKASTDTQKLEAELKGAQLEHKRMSKDWDDMVKAKEAAVLEKEQAAHTLSEKVGELENVKILLEKAEAELNELRAQ